MVYLWVNPDELADSSSPHAYEAAQSASYLMWALSGRKYTGNIRVTEQYECACGFNGGYGVANTRAGLAAGNVYNTRCSSCGGDYEIRLRGRPVVEIHEVQNAGRTLTASEYEVINRSVLRPKTVNGTPVASWDPCTATRVTYTYGQPPPVSGRRAAKRLADELAKSWTGMPCALPERITSVSRQGVSYTILDTQDFLAQGRTGVYEIDLFLKTVNPSGALRKPRVFTPDLKRSVRIQSWQFEPQPDDLVIIPGSSFTKTFSALPGPTLDGVEWKPFCQISLNNGATSIPYDETYWGYELNGDVTFTIPTEQSHFAAPSDGTFDLYAVHVDEPRTTLLLMSSRVYISRDALV